MARIRMLLPRCITPLHADIDVFHYADVFFARFRFDVDATRVVIDDVAMIRRYDIELRLSRR